MCLQSAPIHQRSELLRHFFIGGAHSAMLETPRDNDCLVDNSAFDVYLPLEQQLRHIQVAGIKFGNVY